MNSVQAEPWVIKTGNVLELEPPYIPETIWVNWNQATQGSGQVEIMIFPAEPGGCSGA